MSEDEAKVIEAEGSPPEPTPAPKKKKGRKFRVRAWLLLLVLLAAIGGTGYLYVKYPAQMQSLYRRVMAWTGSHAPAGPAPAALAPVPAAQAPAAPAEPAPAAPPQAAAEPAPAPAPPAPSQAPASGAPSEALSGGQSGQNAAAEQQLMAAIRQLQAQLQQERADNAAVRKALAEQQRMDLKSRLRLIADPATHLKEMSLLWQDVALSPVITEAQREQAESLADAARQALTENRLWLHRLDGFIAETGNPEAGPDVIPHFSHPWLAWLANQFHLRLAVGTADKDNAVLHEKLLNIRGDLALETWPDAKAWQPVRAELVLMVAAAAKPGAKGASMTLGLPNDFTAMRRAVANLHATAQQWLGSGQ